MFTSIQLIIVNSQVVKAESADYCGIRNRKYDNGIPIKLLG
ncbi:hypothetical protein V7201_18720 [Bacillus sp. JJ1122]